jgi:hypothetical protein
MQTVIGCKERDMVSIRKCGFGDVAQWLHTCLECVRPQVQSLAPQKETIHKSLFLKIRSSYILFLFRMKV